MMCGMMVLLVSSCQNELTGEDSLPEGTPVEITLSISSCTKGTRATGVPASPTEDIEKIHHWWVVFVGTDNKVTLIVTRPAANTDYVEEEEVPKIEIPTGKYTTYAFANITQEKLQQLTGITFEGGKTCPNVDAAEIEILQNWNVNGAKNGEDIPMTSKQNVVVSGRVNVDIEVVRAVAKMEVQYTNESSRSVRINKLSLTQTQTTKVPLLPNYTWLEEGYPAGQFATSPVRVDPYVRTYSSVALQPSSAGTTSPWTDVFYMRESKACYNVTDRYLMTLNVTRDGETESEDLHFALDENLKSIYRNDYIVLPLVLSDYKVNLAVRFYPPIGGYPAVISQQSEEEFYCQFGTEGEFEMYLEVLDASNNYSLVYQQGNPHFTYTINSVSDPNRILDKVPASTPSGEIVGRVGNNTGTAYVDVTITVAHTDATDQVYNRRIFVIRK